MRRQIELLRRMERQYIRKHMAHMGLLPPEAHVLYLLFVEEQPRQEDIALKFSLDKGSVARSMARLEELGLVQRQISDHCRREKLVTLTDAGQTAAEQIQALWNDWEEIGYQGFTAAERALYESFLTRIAQNALESKRGEE